MATLGNACGGSGGDGESTTERDGGGGPSQGDDATTGFGDDGSIVNEGTAKFMAGLLTAFADLIERVVG